MAEHQNAFNYPENLHYLLAAEGSATFGRGQRYLRPRVDNIIVSGLTSCFLGRNGNSVDGQLYRAFKIGRLKVGGSTLAVEISEGQHNRLLRRQHCSSLCSQSEGHEHVANMANALGQDFVGYSARACSPRYSSPSLCEQSELQCFASVLRLERNGIFSPNIPSLCGLKSRGLPCK